jgi:glycosidase
MRTLALTAALCLSACAALADTVRVDRAIGPEQPLPGCRGPAAETCELRIYQVMVEAFVDGAPEHDYGAGYGPSHHRGDLRGVIDALDYIRGLGMNAVWLTPIFDSHAGEPQFRLDGTEHVELRLDATGYYTRDYFRIDPNFGTLDDARELVEAAHARGLYVFFDGVFGHHKGALTPSPSGRLPVDSTDPADYGADPSAYPGRVVDYDDPRTLAFYQEVARYWITELGIDGWRLDVAPQVPLPAWRALRTAVQEAAQARRDAGHRWGTLGYMVAEVFSGAGDIAAQALGSAAEPALDAAFDFPLRWATVGVLAGEENGLSRRPASTLNEDWAYGAHTSVYRPGRVLNMMLGNHDFVRFGDLLQRARLADPDEPDWWARHRLAFLVQAAYSGAITRYYGEELGDEVPGFDDAVGGDCAALGLCDDHVARSSAKIPGVSIAPEALSAAQQDLLAFHRRVMAARATYPALSRGSRQHLYSDATLYVDLKTHGSQQVVFAMNTGATPRTVQIDGGLFLRPPQGAWDILAERALATDDGDLGLTLEPLAGAYVLLADAAVTPTAVNFGMADAWYDPATNGQGFQLAVFPQRELVFLGWFTYDAERPPANTPSVLGEPGHRWLTAQGHFRGNRALLEVTRSTGGVFDAPLPPVANAPGGWIELEFDGCRAARLLYRVDPPGLEGEIRLLRITDDNALICEALSDD